MGEILNQILTHGGPVAAVCLVFAIANLGSLWLVLRWADRKQRRLVGAFRRLVRTFADTQARHDARLEALGERFGRVEGAVEDLADEMRRGRRAFPVPEQRSPQ